MRPKTTYSPTMTITVACIATAMLMLDISVINTALSAIASGLKTGLGGLQWVVDAYALPLAATVLTAGAIADRLGRRRLFLAGLSVFTAASAACGAAGTIGTLIASRAVQGLGAAVLFATALALIAQVSPQPEQRAKALAAYGASIGAAFAIGPFIGGALTETLGWRAIFLINVPIGIAALLIAIRRVGEGRDPHARRVDWPGQATLIGALFLLTLWLLRGNAAGWGSPGILAALAGTVLLLGGFIAIERHSTAPMLPLSLFRERRFTGAQVVVLGISSSFFAAFLYMTIYLQGVLGLSPIQTGLVYLPGTMLMFVVSALTAQFASRVSPAKLAVGGLALVAGGMLSMLLTTTTSSWTAILPGELLCCLGTGIFNPAGSALALDALPMNQSGLAAGANDTFRQAGIAIGIAALGTLVPAGAALGGDPAAYVAGFHHALIAATLIAAVCATATAVLLLRRRTWIGRVVPEGGTLGCLAPAGEGAPR
jgi:EmrB/QacA subfamily drug resistance transporter